MVRSKSEAIIADKLHRNEVPYLYENPLHLEAAGIYHTPQTVHPDFTILNKRTRKEFYWEHFGMLDDPDYRKRMLDKIAAYAAEGIILGKNLIVTMESGSNPLNLSEVDQLIEAHLK